MKKNILVFGDSIVYGVGDLEKGGWVNRLRLSLEEHQERNEFNVFNLGISGEITEEVKNRFDVECRARINPEAKTIIIVSMGVNDTQVINGKDRIEIETFKKNMQEVMQMAKQYTKYILFLGLTRVDESKMVPFPWNKEKSCFNNKIDRFDKELRQLCKENKIDYVEVANHLTLEDLYDGLHPNQEGHQKISTIVLEKIKEYIK